MKTCANCGAQNEDHMKFCQECGTPLPVEELPAEKPEEAPVPAAQEIGSEEAVTRVEAAAEETAADETAAQAEELAGEIPAEVSEPAAVEEIPAEGSRPTAAEEIPAEASKAIAAAGEFVLNDAVSEAAETPSAQPVETPSAQPAESAAAATAAAASAVAEPVPAPVNPQPAPKAPSKQKKRKERKPMSLPAVLALIFGIIGVFAGGCACLLSFLNFTVALIFFLPSVLAIVLGLIALRNTGSERSHRGRAIAVIGFVLGLLALVLWLVGIFVLRNAVAGYIGTVDLMSVLRMLAASF